MLRSGHKKQPPQTFSIQDFYPVNYAKTGEIGKSGKDPQRTKFAKPFPAQNSSRIFRAAHHSVQKGPATATGPAGPGGFHLVEAVCLAHSGKLS
jgi:hypothetical protein